MTGVLVWGDRAIRASARDAITGASIEGVSLAVRRRGRPWVAVGYTLDAPRRRPEGDIDDCF